MPNHIPTGLSYEFLGTLDIEAGESLMLGEVQAGWRRYDVLVGGTLRGPRISGQIQAGGSDLLHRHGDLTLHPHVRLVVRTDDDDLVLVTYEGIRFTSPEVNERLLNGEHVPYTEYYLRVAPFFQTSSERYDWLNRIVCVGVGRREGNHVIYEVFQIL
ncbi:MAG: DUF3237 domain-containing protein [Trebonia sp.]